MNVEIGTEGAQLPEREYIKEIFFAVWGGGISTNTSLSSQKELLLSSLLLYLCQDANQHSGNGSKA
jgi:hypothetical protein